jgi:hypothetical protein
VWIFYVVGYRGVL